VQSQVAWDKRGTQKCNPSGRDEFLRAAWRVMVATSADPARLLFLRTRAVHTHTSLAPIYGYAPKRQGVFLPSYSLVPKPMLGGRSSQRPPARRPRRSICGTGESHGRRLRCSGSGGHARRGANRPCPPPQSTRSPQPWKWAGIVHAHREVCSYFSYEISAHLHRCHIQEVRHTCERLIHEVRGRGLLGRSR